MLSHDFLCTQELEFSKQGENILCAGLFISFTYLIKYDDETWKHI